ncbi:MAG TPA: type II CAAX endopeptidase family protein [Terriglobales bacterium]|jgi:membrane protease YdiL (CAAX protease family)|nr:type II CAAX endopeptidase family protein [Terriglobales bacterium]
MATAVTPPASPPTLTRVAPWLHTLLILAFMLFASLYGSGGRQQQEVQQHGRLPAYLSIMILEWLILAFVWVSIRRRGVSLRELVGGKWPTFEIALLDFGIALGFWIASAVVLVAVGLALGLGKANLEEVRRTVGFLAPHNGRELLVWLAVCLTAGFCEEAIFRGLFLRQFSALTRSRWAGVALQALIFGAAHGYQGVRHMAQIAVYGALFGLLAVWRKSLRPGMIAHAWQDTFSGVGLFLLGKFQGWW